MSKNKSYYDRIAEEVTDARIPVTPDLSSVDFDDAYEKADKGDSSAFLCVVLGYIQNRVNKTTAKQLFARFIKKGEYDNPDIVVLPSTLLLALRKDNPCKKETVEMITKYAKKGMPLAMSCLAEMHYYGNEVEQSKELAAHWARKAAEKGEVTAQRKLFPTKIQKAINIALLVRGGLFGR